MARGSLAPGSTVQELARFLPLSPLPKGLAYPALHRSQNPGSPGTSQESEARQGRKRLSESALLPVWLTAPSIPASSPSTEDCPGTRFPINPVRAQPRGLRVSPWRGLPGAIRVTLWTPIWLLREVPRLYTLNLPSRCRRLPLRTPALKLTGRAGGGGPRARRGRSQARGSLSPRPGHGPSLPRPSETRGTFGT